MIASRATNVVERLDTLLTKERLRVYPSILIGMSGLFWMIRAIAAPGSILPDFRARWTAGTMVVDGRGADLYNPVVQSVIQRSEGAHALSWFVSPPPVAVLFAPLGALPYAVAALLWLGISVVGLVLVAKLLRPHWPARWGPYRQAVLILVASQPTFELLGAGQDSWLVLLAGVVAWRLWLAQRFWAAGLAVSVGLLVKPQMMLAAIVLVVVYGGIRMIGGLLLGAVGAALPSLLVLGPPIWIDWIRAISSSTFTNQVTLGQSYKSASFQGFTIAVAPDAAAHVAAAFGLVAGFVLLTSWIVWLVGSRRPQWMVLSTAAFVTVLAAPHAMVYDLVIVLPATAMLVQHRPGPAVRVAVAVGFVAVWFGPTLSFLRTAPWPVSALSAQWVVLVPLTLTIGIMAPGLSLCVRKAIAAIPSRGEVGRAGP